MNSDLQRINTLSEHLRGGGALEAKVRRHLAFEDDGPRKVHMGMQLRDISRSLDATEEELIRLRRKTRNAPTRRRPTVTFFGIEIVAS